MKTIKDTVIKYVAGAAMLFGVGCGTYMNIDGRFEPHIDARAVGGHRSSTLDVKFRTTTPLQIGGYPVGVFVRDRLTSAYGTRAQREHPERLGNFAITDLNYGGAFKAVVGTRSVATLDTERTHDSTGRIDLRAGIQYGTLFETGYGDFRVFVQPTVIVNPRHPSDNLQGEVLAKVGYDGGVLEAEVETITRFNRQGVQQGIQRFQGFVDLEEALGIPGLRIGPQVEMVETRENRDPTVNAGAVLRFDW